MKKIKKEKEVDRDDIGFEEEEILEGFSEDMPLGKVIKSFSFDLNS